VRAIHLAALDKTRPVLVLTREIAVGSLRTVTVAAITSTIRGLATEVPVGPDNGLDHASAVNLDNVFTIDRRALGRRVGFLLDRQEVDLHRAVVAAFDLNDTQY
jgi:mRNA interferase MazF